MVCQECDGIGKLYLSPLAKSEGVRSPYEIDCPKCKGTGQIGIKIVDTKQGLIKPTP